MKSFVQVFAVWVALDVVFNLVCLGTGYVPTLTTGGIAIDTGISFIVLIWSLALLYGKATP